MHEPDFLLFASDASLFALGGATLLVVALLAMRGERRRLRRTQIDAVGWVPWTTLFFLCFFPGAILLALAAKGWLAG